MLLYKLSSSSHACPTVFSSPIRLYVPLSGVKVYKADAAGSSFLLDMNHMISIIWLSGLSLSTHCKPHLPSDYSEDLEMYCTPWYIGLCMAFMRPPIPVS